MKRLAIRLFATAFALVAPVEAARAHIVAARLGDFYAGALHPLLDLRDIVLWVAVGTLAATQGAAKARLLTLLFPLGLLVGMALAHGAGVGSTNAVTDAGMMVALGLLLAADAPIPSFLLSATSFVLAAARGVANAAEIGTGTDVPLFAAGVASAGYVAITLIMAAALAFIEPPRTVAGGWRRIVFRALGGWIAALGLLMGGLAVST